MRKRYLVALLISLGCAVAVYAAQRHPGIGKGIPSPILTATEVPPPPPELEHAQVQNDIQHLQLIQTQVQVLNYQFEQTKASLAQKLKALERDGFDLNVETWTYVRKGTK